ncbi:MAG TPA: hypothetical protein DEQ38_03635 [Elusimicrobia bacterium]|nr:MAG: hypothetical protein A2089_03900 [Elusimicrobia bacterium GWD2_63_28]HCC47196.1 hypothetical protein [Elusimicrobiota bacterium]
MKGKLLAGAIAFSFLLGAGAAMAGETIEKARKKSEEKTGTIEVIKADEAKKEKYNTVLLKVGEETIKLLPGADKKNFKKLETLGGKTVTVKGALLPAHPPKYPLAAIKVDSFKESAAKAPAKK